MWVILVAISLGYLWFDNEATHKGIPIVSALVTVCAICFALIKVRIIIGEFMEVRAAPSFSAPSYRFVGRTHGRRHARGVPRWKGSRLAVSVELVTVCYSRVGGE